MYIKNLIRKGLIAGLSIILIAISAAPLFAGNIPDILNPNFQGIAMENSSSYLIVSERKVLISQGTQILNSKKQGINLSDIKVGNHVYIKGEFDDNNNVVAERIYLLPGYVPKHEVDKYPFMKGKE